jgi:hypothetical protein
MNWYIVDPAEIRFIGEIDGCSTEQEAEMDLQKLIHTAESQGWGYISFRSSIGYHAMKVEEFSIHRGISSIIRIQKNMYLVSADAEFLLSVGSVT